MNLKEHSSVPAALQVLQKIFGKCNRIREHRYTYKPYRKTFLIEIQAYLNKQRPYLSIPSLTTCWMKWVFCS